MKICLDAGHGTGQNQSPARCGYFEGDRMFTLQRLLQQELEAYGVTVVCTRAARQDDPPLYTRALAAKDCDLFLSLHSNAAGNGVCESVDYPVVFYPVSGKGIGLAAELAECIHKTMGTLQPAQTRVRWNSAHNADYYGVIRFTAAFGVTGMILEHSFHTNTRMTTWLLDDENLKRLAAAEAAAIAEHYGLKKTADEPQRGDGALSSALRRAAGRLPHRAGQADRGGHPAWPQRNGRGAGAGPDGGQRPASRSAGPRRCVRELTAGQSRCKIRNRKQTESGGNCMERIEEQLRAYCPWNEQEEADCAELLRRLGQGEDLWTRENRSAHLTASGWIVSPERSRVLMAYHNLYDSWSWLGGHADGDHDLLAVALREAQEESGLSTVRAVSPELFSVEILTVDGHEKRGHYVPSHLHLNVTYLLEADPALPIRCKPDENSRVGWFGLDEAVEASSEPWFRERIYSKLNAKLCAGWPK